MLRTHVVVVAVLALCALAVPVALAADSGGAAPTASATAPSSTKVLKRGSRGPLVRTLQRALKIDADGVYGAATVRAVKRFQRFHGLEVDGIAGPATQSALGIATTARATPLRLLERIALCESGGNPKAVSPDGRYRGKYQFSRSTWRRLGGKGDPARASEAEQDRRAAQLLATEGTKPWPSCSRKAS